jgi:hypothetical protein
MVCVGWNGNETDLLSKGQVSEGKARRSLEKKGVRICGEDDRMAMV